LIIIFERTGGFAGITQRAVIDSADLSPEEQQALEALLEQAGFFDLPPRMEGEGVDRFQYLVTIEHGDRKHTVALSEEAMPENLQPLMRRLSLLARRFRSP
jgi:hypothetical protein